MVRWNGGADYVKARGGKRPGSKSIVALRRTKKNVVMGAGHVFRHSFRQWLNRLAR